MKFFSNRMKEAYVTSTVMVICIVIFILCNIDFGLSSQIDRAIFLGAYYKAFVSAGEWWRLITAGFVHINLWHVLLNLYSFYNIGPAMEKIYGHRQYALILFASIIGGSACIFAFDGNTVAVGLSGGLYGLMAAFFLQVIKAGGWHVPQYRNMIINIAVVNLFINFMPSVSVMAHLGGFIIGGLLAEILTFDLNRTLQNNTRVALCMLILVVGVLMYRNRGIDPSEQYIGTDMSVLRFEYEIGLKNHASKMASNLDDLYDIHYLESYIGG